MPITPADLLRMKQKGERIPMVTAYDYSAARIAARAGIPLLLVGDSLGMVMHGHGTTLPVTLDDMVRHAAAVTRGSGDAMVVGDLPFLTYANEADAVTASRRMLAEGSVHCVKLEGGAAIAPIVRRLTELGVPVMGHLGFTPQSQHQIGLRVQAKQAAAAKQLLEDALLLEASGVCAIVLELVPAALAKAVSERLAVPTIGIGAGAGCDGQVQVWHDLLGLTEGKVPRHAGRYAELGEVIAAALGRYAEDVRAGVFPKPEQDAAIDPQELQRALGEG
ncbi:3-methyl-2-oxobutanoate hydroxymethyltransferase [Sphingomonas vulcanisoli]|uniref:3-methyl-2-oxobutanoate hydroxymethyltransferase n=1 Tax=Sphingomonas vulcanisoli TaxID=1658060 RepID=A0ABX0TPR8_9SPHN|nr:3-methyl-2-oxobutanoate hydroxymethyltransferase [Sphingomonas vulcanisoli]NIJ07538.1 3-methyl-2-oxobutanoate hydroxymethyltransferase [Sphingomonas vulcanisoli]